LLEAVAGEQRLGWVKFEFDQPADIEVWVGAALGEARQPDGRVRRLRAVLGVGSRIASWAMDQASAAAGPRAMGISLHPAGHTGAYTPATLGMVVSTYGRQTVAGRAWVASPDPIGQVLTMRRNPFLDFQLTAERAGYPALLIVSLLCLALVVVPVALLALTEAVWVLVLALLSVVGAVAILAAGIAAVFADADERDVERPPAVPAPNERPEVTRLGRRKPSSPPAPHDRKAA
jgi:hypothetical protein